MTTANRLPAIHPGQFLAEIIEELDLSQAAVARALGVTKMQISHLVHGSRPVTAEMALLLGKAFEQTPDYWLNLQMDYDLKMASKRTKEKVQRVQTLHRAA